MKRILCLSLLLWLSMPMVFSFEYDFKMPVVGKSIVDVSTQRDVLSTVYAYTHRVATPDCTSFSVINTEISQQKKDNKWQEIWTVKACSKTVNIPIDFDNIQGKNMYKLDPLNVKVKCK